MGAKSDRSNSLLGIQMGKAVKKCQKYDENNKKKIAKIAHFLRAKVRFALKKPELGKHSFQKTQRSCILFKRMQRSCFLLRSL